MFSDSRPVIVLPLARGRILQVPNVDVPVQVKYANKNTLVYETASSQVTQAALEFRFPETISPGFMQACLANNTNSVSNINYVITAMIMQ